MLETHVRVRKLPAQTAAAYSSLILLEGLCCSFGKWHSGQKGRAWEKGTRGIWTLALIYRLEAGVIKQFLSGIQMRNLVGDLRTWENENVCFLVMLRPHQSGSLTHFVAPCQLMETVLSGGGQTLTPNSAALLRVSERMLTFNLKLQLHLSCKKMGVIHGKVGELD